MEISFLFVVQVHASQFLTPNSSTPVHCLEVLPCGFSTLTDGVRSAAGSTSTTSDRASKASPDSWVLPHSVLGVVQVLQEFSRVAGTPELRLHLDLRSTLVPMSAGAVQVLQEPRVQSLLRGGVDPPPGGTPLPMWEPLHSLDIQEGEIQGAR